ncbi:MAG: hypothetical protein ACK57C_09130, partial [Bacteroidota bacterium]
MSVRLFYILFFSCTALFSFSQGGNFSTPGCAHGLSDYYRRQELITGQTSPTSLLQQQFTHQLSLLDSLFPFPDSLRLFKQPASVRKVSLQLLPASVTIAYNSHHPFGWNDAAMIPANGLQTMASGGFLLKS